MPIKPSAAQRDSEYRELFLAKLNRRLTTPTAAWPTLRYWVGPTLNSLFALIREELTTEGIPSRQSHLSLLKWLQQLGLACPLPIEGDVAYLLEMGASETAETDPIELLMAKKPAGVISYFSAVVFHGLTTQPAGHHHIAELRPHREPVAQGDTPQRPLDSSVKKTAPRGPQRHPFGKPLFHLHGIPFYSTVRSQRLVPGIQTRAYGPRAQICITTFEQTLLDTLYKPFHCGGPEVVFEAWQDSAAARRIDEERLLDYLQKMQYPATTRRVGVMLELTGIRPGASLQRYLQDSQQAIDRAGAHARISLLPGVNYQQLNQTWLVNTP